MTSPRYNHTLCAYRSLIYAFGGCNNKSDQNSIEYYNGTVWSVAAIRLPRPQMFPSVLPVKQGLLLIDGCHSSDIGRSINIWEERTQQWRTIRAVKANYSLSNAIAMRGGVIYIYSHTPSRYFWPIDLDN